MNMRIVTKKEMIEIIERIPEDNFMLMEYDSSVGISDIPKRCRKKKCKDEIGHAKTIIYSEDFPICQLDFYKKKLKLDDLIKFSDYRGNSILFLKI